jgi:uncharacterized membrane protein YkvI
MAGGTVSKGSLTTLGAPVFASGAMFAVGVGVARIHGPEGWGQYFVVLAMDVLLQMMAGVVLTLSNPFHAWQRTVEIRLASDKSDVVLSGALSTKSVPERQWP